MIELRTGEKVIATVRRHWYLLALESFFLVLLVFVPLAAFAFLSASQEFLEDARLISIFVFATANWYLLLWTLFFIVWTNYYLDVWIITNERLVDAEQHRLFSREIAECPLYRIQDVIVEVHGLLPTLLRFGDIHVQTAGAQQEFTMRHVPHPHRIKNIIFEQHEQARRKGMNE